jgi:hypothetical protein
MKLLNSYFRNRSVPTPPSEGKGQNRSWKNDFQSTGGSTTGLLLSSRRKSLLFVMPWAPFQKQMKAVQGVMGCAHSGPEVHGNIQTCNHQHQETQRFAHKDDPISFFSLVNDSWHHGYKSA